MSTGPEKLSQLLTWLTDHLGGEYAQAFQDNEVDDWQDVLDDENVRDVLEGFSNVDAAIDAIGQIEAGTLGGSSRIESGRAQMFHDYLEEKFGEEGYSGMLVGEGFVDWESIEELTKESLRDCGIKKLGHRTKIVKFLSKLREMTVADETKETEDAQVTVGSSTPMGRETSGQTHVAPVRAMKLKVQQGAAASTQIVKLRSNELMEELVEKLALTGEERMFYVDSDDDEILIMGNEDLADASRRKKVVRVATESKDDEDEEPGAVAPSVREVATGAKSSVSGPSTETIRPRAALKLKIQRGETREAVKLRSNNLMEEMRQTLGLSGKERIFYVDSDEDEVLIQTDEDLVEASRGKKAVCVVASTREGQVTPQVATLLDEKEMGMETDSPVDPAVETPRWPPGVHVVPHKIVVSDRLQAMHENSNLKRNQFVDLKGPGSIDIPDNKLIAILVVGKTGAGKTTMINSMVNVLYGVKFEDDFRLKLIVEPPTDDRKSQADSQTNQVFGYLLEEPPLLLGKSLLIVDTPGFGDSRGFARDEIIMASIKEFFENKIDFLNAVCFVCKAPDARVGPLEKYIFDKVLGLFGNDIAEIIMLLFTFADGEEPPALTAIEEQNVEYKEWVPLNNSAFFLDKSKKASRMAPFFWEMGVESLNHFLVTVNSFPRNSLESCRQVLRRRQELQTAIGNMRDLVALGLSKLDELEQTVRVMKSSVAEMKATEDFEFEVDVSTRVKKEKPQGLRNTVCDTCTWTCHDDCAYDDGPQKKGCCAFDNSNGGYCRYCPGKCHWSDHHNRDYFFDLVITKEKKTKDDLKKRYCDAESEMGEYEQIMSGLQAELSVVEQGVYQLVCQIKDNVNELNRMALRPGLMHDDQYFDLMIEQERKERKIGWQRRANDLEKIKERSKYLSDVASDDFDPFGLRRQMIADEAKPLRQDAPASQDVTFINKVGSKAKTFLTSLFG